MWTRTLMQGGGSSRNTSRCRDKKSCSEDMYTPEHAPLSADSLALSHHVLLKQETPVVTGKMCRVKAVRPLSHLAAPHAISTFTVSRGVNW